VFSRGCVGKLRAITSWEATAVCVLPAFSSIRLQCHAKVSDAFRFPISAFIFAFLRVLFVHCEPKKSHPFCFAMTLPKTVLCLDTFWREMNFSSSACLILFV